MVTSNAGRCLGLPHLSRIEPGELGDFFILRSPLESDNALEVFMSTTDRHVRATIIAGTPIYGDRKLLQQFGEPLQRLPRLEGSAVADKAVYLPPQIKIDIDRDITKIEQAFKSLPKPVKRSNLLADADKPYRRRIKKLREEVEQFGWYAQVWRRKGPSVRPGVAPVPPNAVRVWRGFKAEGTSNAEFRDKIGRIFIPAAVQTQAPLGMTAYLPAVLPEARPPAIPDEIALVFYKNRRRPMAVPRRRPPAASIRCCIARCSHRRARAVFRWRWTASSPPTRRIISSRMKPTGTAANAGCWSARRRADRTLTRFAVPSTASSRRFSKTVHRVSTAPSFWPRIRTFSTGSTAPRRAGRAQQTRSPG